MDWAEVVKTALDALVVLVLWWQRRQRLEVREMRDEFRNGNGSGEAPSPTPEPPRSPLRD